MMKMHRSPRKLAEVSRICINRISEQVETDLYRELAVRPTVVGSSIPRN
jgi:hypothetical protein